MKTKTGASIKNLNTIFTDPLKKFDLLHKQMTGNEAVITSVDTGKHWGSIKKADRPDNWEQYNETGVRMISNSKHYNNPCDAVDLRRRCPDGKLTYYDDLTDSEQRYFRAEIDECFPDEFFDVVFSRLCIHVEHDPDFDVRKPRGLTNDENRTDDDLDPQEPTTIPPYTAAALEKTELPPLPMYKKSGFKRKLGGLFLLTGGILSLIPQTSAIGQGLLALGGVTGITGMAHGVVKNKKTDNKTQIVKTILIWIVGLIMKYITRKKKEK